MIKRISVLAFIITILMVNNVFSQEKYLSLKDFQKPTGDWFEAGDVKSSVQDEKKLDALEGDGVFMNGEKGRTVHFITADKHGNLKLKLEFMVAKGSNSGVYLQGRYEVQVLDSWGRTKMYGSDCGGIYQRWDENREGNKGYDGIPPLANASKPPGEWQTLYIDFKAPRFNSKGEKTRNARFKKVVLNGVVVQKNVEATGPTRSSLDNLEEPTGPLMLQGDHGPVAYRNLQLE
jgi:hypothetical protein